MKNIVGRFEKVSKEQFVKDWLKTCGGTEADALEIYEKIQLPRRATKGSAGYDFFAPCDIILPGQKTCLVPTGIRVEMIDSYVLLLFPRSSLGFKYRMQLDNSVGVIDSDYYHADNEGHIFLKFTNDSKQEKTIEVKAGQGLAQGIFIPFGIVEEEEVTTMRTGGFGSTTEGK